MEIARKRCEVLIERHASDLPVDQSVSIGLLEPGKGDLKSCIWDIEKTFKVESGATGVLVGVPGFSRVSTRRVCREFAYVTELKVEASVSELPTGAVLITEKPLFLIIALTLNLGAPPPGGSWPRLDHGQRNHRQHYSKHAQNAQLHHPPVAANAPHGADFAQFAHRGRGECRRYDAY